MTAASCCRRSSPHITTALSLTISVLMEVSDHWPSSQSAPCVMQSGMQSATVAAPASHGLATTTDCDASIKLLCSDDGAQDIESICSEVTDKNLPVHRTSPSFVFLALHSVLSLAVVSLLRCTVLRTKRCSFSRCCSHSDK